VVLPLPATASSAAKPADAPRGGQGLRLLAVDDAPPNRLVLEAYFHGSPHELHTAADAAAALAMFGATAYDLVLMDVSMPGMDGYAATRAMRALEMQQARGHTPILAFTAHALPEDVARSRQAGCDGHLVKPLRKDVLMDALRRYAGSGEGVRHDGEPQRGTGDPTPLVTVPPELVTYVPEYLASTRDQLSVAITALDRGSREELRTLGHNLKGSGGSFGLREVSRLGTRIEQLASRGTDAQVRDCALALATYLAGVQVLSEEV
jgi:CheY-like chemotaxis protein